MNTFELDIDSCKNQIVELHKYTRGMRVLLVEDNLTLQENIKRLFLSLFYEVDATSNGVEALEFYKKQKTKNLGYDVVFSDIEMPYMNGIEFTKKIKDINEEQVIVIFSAYKDTEYLLELINLGVRRFISKPIFLKTFLDEMDNICRSIVDKKNLLNIVQISKNMAYDKEKGFLSVNSEQVMLTNYESIILELLISKINLVVSNEEIVNYLYLNSIDVELENIRKIIYKLRKKLPQNFILGVHGIGYKVTSQQ